MSGDGFQTRRLNDDDGYLVVAFAAIGIRKTNEITVIDGGARARGILYKYMCILFIRCCTRPNNNKKKKKRKKYKRRLCLHTSCETIAKQ